MALICAGLVKLLFVARDRLLSWQKGFDLIASASGRAALRSVRAEATRSVAVTVRGVSHAFDLAGTKLPVLDSLISRSPPGNSSHCSVRQAMASRLCCTSCPVLSGRRPALSRPTNCR